MKVLEQYYSMVEALRPLVGENGWDYCILWKLSQDQRYLEWMGCCCSGTEAITESGGGLFSDQRTTCRDLKFEHPRTRACEILHEFPSSIPLASSLEIYAQVLMSNQPTWQTNHLVSSISSYETVGAQTRALVPIQGGLVELAVSKHIPEDQQTVDFIMSSFEDNCDYPLNPGWPSQQFVPSADPQSFQWDLSSPLNLFDGSVAGPTPQMDSTVDSSVYQQQSMIASGQGGGGGSSVPVGGVQEKESVKQEGRKGDSVSEGSDEEEDTRPVGRNGKRHQSKNLMAERKRRKKLNDRLYALRSLVPKITKMDRASILGDAIEYVMDLQKRVKDLQDELEEDTINPEDDEGNKQIGSNMEASDPNGTMVMMMSNSTLGMELDESPNSSRAMADPVKQSPINEDKGPQMEPQVEVKKLEGNDFYLKVFCEHKFGGFTRLMEAVSSLGLEVTNVNVTTLGTLVLNVFTVQKRDNEMMQVDQVRDSLLELTRGPNGGWVEHRHTIALNTEDCPHDKHHHRRNHHSHHHQLHYLHQQP